VAVASQVFISYARASSSEQARAVRGALEAAGISVFLDERDIPLGSKFPSPSPPRCWPSG
jgi:hypothetical protein